MRRRVQVELKIGLPKTTGEWKKKEDRDYRGERKQRYRRHKHDT